MSILLSPRLWVAGIIVALVIALLSTRATLAEVKGERDLANAKLAVSNASIAALETDVGRCLAAQQMLEQSDAQRMQASREMIAIADAASKARRAVIARLEQSAAANEALADEQEADKSACTFSDAVNAAWPGE